MEILLFFVMNNKIDRDDPRDDPIVQIALYEYFMAKSADLIPEGIAVLARDGRIFLAALSVITMGHYKRRNKQFLTHLLLLLPFKEVILKYPSLRIPDCCDQKIQRLS